MDIAATIRRAREQLGLTQSEVARRLKVSKTAVSKWEEGETAPNRNRVAEVARVLGLKPSDLLAHARVGLTLVDDETSGRMIPVMCLNDIPESGMPTDPAALAAFPKVLADVSEELCAVALRVEGSEMAAEINDGDVVIVSPTVIPRKDDVVVAVVDHEIMLRRYKPRGIDTSGNTVFDLFSTNPEVATRTVNASHPGRILAVVIEHRRKRQP